MNLKRKIKDNKIFSILTFLFIAWIALLIWLSIFGSREVYFYDALDEKEVSSKYSSKVPLLRYIIEPIIGISLNLDAGFVSGMFFLFIISRISYIFLKKKGYFQSEKASLLWYPVKDFIRFSFITLFFTFLSCILIALVIFLIAYYYITLYWMMLVQIALHIAFILIILKGIYLVTKFLHPNLKLNYLEKKRFQIKERQSTSYKLSRILRKESTYFLGIAFLFVSSSLIVTSVLFPLHTIETDLDNDEFIFDFHVHTTMSDGWLSPEERVQWYIDHGIMGAAFSDHDNLKGAIAARKYVEQYDLDFYVIQAEEWTDNSNDIHMNIFGLDETIVPLESEMEDGPKAMNAEDTIKYVKKKGAYIIVNHYNYNENPDGGYGTPYTLKELRNWGVDGFEIVNGGGLQAEEIREFCLDNDLICLSVTDMHGNEELDSFTKFKLDDPDDIDLDSIFDSLYENKHECVAININPKYANIPLLDTLELGIFRKFAEYLLNLDRFQCLSWIIWSCGIFALFSYTFKRAKRLDVNQLKEKIL